MPTEQPAVNTSIFHGAIGKFYLQNIALVEISLNQE
jgi:hypothetical protein